MKALRCVISAFYKKTYQGTGPRIVWPTVEIGSDIAP
jgi:hypothetical protein